MKNDIKALEVGKSYSNQELQDIFQCGNTGGMRYSKKTNTLVIISNDFEGFYKNRWDGDILYYVGMGKKGDQDIDLSQNKRLKNCKDSGTTLYLFEVLKKGSYTYLGIPELVSEPYQEKQIDIEGHERNVWIFPLRVKESSLRDTVIQEKNGDLEKKCQKMSEKELIEKIKSGVHQKSMRTTISNVYERNPFVVEYTKRNAKGICQLCQKKAPFDTKNGEPYLEVHHIKWLSQGGEDTLENTVALCPNCHRKMHIVNDPVDIDKLLKTKSHG
jgi:5-methylcytosine-specific restriction protein A